MNAPTTNADAPIGLAIPLTADEVAQFNELRAEFKPEASRKRVEEFGKWLFVSVAAVGTLGAGFSNAAFQNLAGSGRWAFALAVMLAGVSLAFATIGLAPSAKRFMIVPDSMESMRAVLLAQLERRVFYLQIATGFFAVALSVAALAPILSTMTIPKKTAPEPKWTSVTFDITNTGALTAELDIAGLTPHSSFAFGLVTEPVNSKQQLPHMRGTVDAAGKGKAKLTLADVRKIKGRLFAVSKWGQSTGQVGSAGYLYTQRLEIPRLLH